MRRELLVALRLTLVVAAMCVAYTFLTTGIAQVAFNASANGSLLTHNGQIFGARLIGQSCPKENLAKDGSLVIAVDPRYFQGRLSYTIDLTTGKLSPCNAAASTGSNYAPSNPLLVENVKAAIKAYRAQGVTGDIPVDLVTADFTGFDPDISEAAALVQIPMVARARSLGADQLTALVESQVQGRILFVFGEPHVNVLSLNLALDRLASG